MNYESKHRLASMFAGKHQISFQKAWDAMVAGEFSFASAAKFI